MSAAEATAQDTAPASAQAHGVHAAAPLEIRLIGGRRRNQMGLLVLAAVPVVLAISVRLSSSGGQGGGPDFLDSVTSNGLFVPLAALGVEMGIFLLAISMLAGDAIAGEANLGTPGTCSRCR